MEKITVQNTSVMIISINKNDYISLTDIAKYKSDDPTAVIGNWMRNRNTIEYLGIWESLYNPNFKPLEFEGFKKKQVLMLLLFLLTSARIKISEEVSLYILRLRTVVK